MPGPAFSWRMVPSVSQKAWVVYAQTSSQGAAAAAVGVERSTVTKWFASHADSGTPGPHVHLRTSDRQDAVLRTEQIPELVALSVVSERIDRAWANSGDEHAENVVLRSPDPQDPDVVRRRHVEHLRFMQTVANNLPEVARMLARASSTDEALVDIAGLLGVDEADVMARLARFDMLALTRAAYEKRLQQLDDIDR